MSFVPFMSFLFRLFKTRPSISPLSGRQRLFPDALPLAELAGANA
jgi:hypothetical protein